jgi:predicted fused transcriptional regulator/phosphomethylpyrimidine kinase
MRVAAVVVAGAVVHGVVRHQARVLLRLARPKVRLQAVRNE